MKKFLAILLCAIMILPTTPITVGAETLDSGTCGDNLTWTLDSSGTLTISGEGEMYDYSYSPNAPWHDSRGSITNIIIGSGVTSIGSYAFNFCGYVTSVKIPNSVTKIGRAAFQWCDNLTDITIPERVTSIEGGAFWGCLRLTSVNIPSSVTTIGNEAFENCNKLTNIYITDLTAYLSINFNGYCSNPMEVLSHHKLYLNNRLVTSITIPNTVNKIPRCAFMNCIDLKSVIISNSVTSIDDAAFYWCENLESINIPSSVTDIGNSTFRECNVLKDVYYGGAREQWQNINMGVYNEDLTGATIHYNSVTDTEPTKFAGMPTVSAGNGAYTVSATLQDIDKSCVMVAALYNGRKLAGVKIINLSKGQTSAVASVSAVRADTAKVCIWDSAKNMKPLCEPKTITIK